MKKIILFLLVAVVLAACAEKKSSSAPADEYAGLTESSYTATDTSGGATSGEQTVYVYRSDSGRIEKVRIEESIPSIALNIIAKANVEYSGEEPVKFSGSYNAGGKDTPFEITNAAQVQGMLNLVENEQYVPLPR